MKIFVQLWFLTVLLSAGALVQAQSETQPPTFAYVSDALEIPLRAGASNRYKIIGAVRGGTAVEVLKVDGAKAYTQIRTPTGVKGWLPSDRLTETPGSQEQLASVRQELERLKARHQDLLQHMDTVVNAPEGGENMSYPQLYEEALRLRQQLAQYRRVASDTVALDERNRTLQEQVVALERQLQLVEQENRGLRNDNHQIRMLMGAVILGVCLLLAVMMPRIREQRRAQWSRL
jgi:SH3 domain protein